MLFVHSLTKNNGKEAVINDNKQIITCGLTALSKQMLSQVREGGGGHYFGSFIAKHITAAKPKFTLTEVDIKSLEHLLAL